MPIEKLQGPIALIDLPARHALFWHGKSVEEAVRRNFTRIICDERDIMHIFIDNLRGFSRDRIFTVVGH